MSTSSIIANALNRETPEAPESSAATAETTETKESVNAETEAEEAAETEDGQAEAESDAAEASSEAEPEEGEEGEQSEKPEEEGEPEEETEQDLDRKVTDEEAEEIAKKRWIKKERFDRIYPFYNKAKDLGIESAEQMEDLVSSHELMVNLETRLTSGNPKDVAPVVEYLASLDDDGTAVRSLATTLPYYLRQRDHDGYRQVGRHFYDNLIAELRKDEAAHTDEEERKALGYVRSIVAAKLAKYGFVNEEADAAPKDPKLAEENRALREQQARLRQQAYEAEINETNAMIDEKLGALVNHVVEELENNEAFPKGEIGRIRKQFAREVEDVMKANRVGQANLAKLQRAYVNNPTKQNRANLVNAYVTMGAQAVKEAQAPFLSRQSRKVVEANNERLAAKKASSQKRSLVANQKPAPAKLPTATKAPTSARDVLKAAWSR